jgi:hypothetical protein
MPNGTSRSLSRKTDRSAAALPLTPSSSLPPSVALAVEDPIEVEAERDGVRVMVPGTWRPPTHRLLPDVLKQGLETIEHLLAPASAEAIGAAMMPLVLTTKVAATEGMSDEKALAFYQAKTAETTRLLVKAEVPIDLLKEAADKCSLASRYFPEVADLMEHIRPALEKRKRQRERIAILIDGASKPAEKPKPEPFKAEPLDVRLATMRDSYRRIGDIAKAAKYERELAKLKGREPEDWARDVVEATVLPSPPQPSRSVGPPKRYATDVDHADVEPKAPEWKRAPDAWQAGQPLYQRAAEEPPPPTEIPEAGDIEVEP